jgi:hypothetical protein
MGLMKPSETILTAVTLTFIFIGLIIMAPGVLILFVTFGVSRFVEERYL